MQPRDTASLTGHARTQTDHPTDLPLARILAAAPQRLDIRDGEGRQHFSSTSAAAVAPATRSFAVDVDGASYSVGLTLDESEQNQREQELIRRAYSDDLTGLANRSLFERSLDALIASEPAGFALALIDIDGFKHV